jgi:IS30 family transposase
MVKAWGMHLHRVKRSFRCDGECSGDVMLQTYRRKEYTRTHPYPEHIHRHQRLPREAATTVLLRKHGYPMNMIATFLGRSLSFVYRILRRNIDIGNLRYMNFKRNMPAATLTRESIRRWEKLLKLWQAWQDFLEGKGEKPP